MMTLGSIGFAAPLALAGLFALPVIWWLLRVTPPAPNRVRFPAIRLLKGLGADEETPAHTPWWLMALRLAAAALLVFAFAEPVLNPGTQATGDGPLLVVVDDGWAAASRWETRSDTLNGILASAQRGERQTALLTTAPSARPQPLEVMTAEDAAAAAAALQPKPFAVDRAAAAQRLIDANLSGTWSIAWLADGIATEGDDALADELASLGNVTIYGEPGGGTALALRPPAPSAQSFDVTAIRAGTEDPRTATLRAYGEKDRLLAEAPISFDAGNREAQVRLEMPLELRNAVTRLDIAEETSAAAVSLLDDRWQRRTVGLVGGGGTEDAQPLLSDLYYLRRAIAPFAEVREAQSGTEGSEIEHLLSRPLSLLVTADVGQLVGEDADTVREWVEGGGTLVRFAGPRLAASADDLMPVRLRGGGRALGGALTWATPQGLAPLPEDSPFAGLEVPSDVEITRQVLAEPSPDLSERTWARLQDGTPLVTAAPRGDGWVILFHVSADTDWSNLPISGLYVEMLRRILDLSRGTAGASPDDTGRLLPPLRSLDGRGRLSAPPPLAEPLAADKFAGTRAGPAHPPGLYGSTTSFRALNLIGPADMLRPLDTDFADTVAPYAGTAETALKPLLLLTALALLIADGLAALALSGRLPRFRNAAAALLATALVVPLAPQSRAQDFESAATEPGDEIAMLATLDTRLAYVITGDTAVDDMSRAGLTGLSNVLRNRTAVEPADPLGVNVETDELAFYPLIYWPVLPGQRTLSPDALAKVDAYMKRGGTILFDTMDHQQVEAIGNSPGNEALRRLLGELDIPPLEPVGEGHVLTKAFYLMPTFPGRWAGGELWVQADGEAQDMPGALNQDGVTPILIGSNDYAAAWAVDASGRPLASPVPGGERQREQARRFGVNLVMYALTGNYKADQVHVPALLERLGQ